MKINTTSMYSTLIYLPYECLLKKWVIVGITEATSSDESSPTGFDLIRSFFPDTDSAAGQFS